MQACLLLSAEAPPPRQLSVSKGGFFCTHWAALAPSQPWLRKASFSWSFRSYGPPPFPHLSRPSACFPPAAQYIPTLGWAVPCVRGFWEGQHSGEGDFCSCRQIVGTWLSLTERSRAERHKARGKDQKMRSPLRAPLFPIPGSLAWAPL